ncbi:MAG: methyl-accepting chemotaxis protein, partial [Betaproteobacteria bacterium]|nr:methyl-accepting chemotaxis protein [Betaproteobacteria bacterium]
MLALAGSLMIYLTYAQRRDGSIAQAQDFAASTNQMTVAAITGMMITGVMKQRAAYLDLVKNTNSIRDLQVFRYGTTISQYGAGDNDEAKAPAEVRSAMAGGKPHFKTDEAQGTLEAIYPMLNSRNYLGNDCTGCHEGKEGEVLGAVSMRVDLKKMQAELWKFTWSIALIGLGLSLPLLGSIYFLVRRLVNRPLGGEPAAATAVADRIAACDLSVEVALKGSDTNSLMAAMGRMQHNLSGVIGQINQAASTITTASHEIAAGNTDLSQRTEEQASSLEETASSMEELTSTVKQNAENAKQANQLALGASAVAVKGGSVVSQVVETMSSINESSKKIVDIIGVIDGIAFQTNILALNAAVEAARAGEQGRGFAVVASEVRNLAQRSAAAAKEIKTLIGDSVDKVGAGTKLVDEAGKTMEEVVASVKRVTDIMGEITAASQEQSAGIEQVNQAITQMDEVTQQNAALVEEAAAAAESMEEQARNL